MLTTLHEAEGFERLLGDVWQFGIEIGMRSNRPRTVRRKPPSSGAEFVGDDAVSLVLVDNIFYGPGLGA